MAKYTIVEIPTVLLLACNSFDFVSSLLPEKKNLNEMFCKYARNDVDSDHIGVYGGSIFPGVVSGQSRRGKQ